MSISSGEVKMDNFFKDLELYVVRSKDGMYYAKEPNYSNPWTEEISKARVFTVLGQARSAVTRLYNSFKLDDPPDLIELVVNSAKVIDQEDRVKKANLKRSKSELKADIKHRGYKVEKVQHEIDKLSKELVELHKGV